MVEVRYENVTKRYENGFEAVKNLDLNIADGEFLVLLGPSGCGKSTTLRMLAGLEDVSVGDIVIDSTKVNDLPPGARGLGMVFQSYALYPHMTIAENLSFGLRMEHAESRLSDEEIVKRVQEVAKLMELIDQLEKKPKQLSGGQRQRVALGRALIRRPQVLLMDEPLSNLDAELRHQMRQEIRRLHDQLGTTTVYVTHDQIEAMTLADRIVIMNKGEIQQHGAPLDVYNNPENEFVRGFLCKHIDEIVDTANSLFPRE
tara:strand:- start:108 stop:881 length:774 start_codon:yes stop_codon:yes gene_type:complete